MAVNISEERVKQLQKISQDFCVTFALTDEQSKGKLLSLLHPEIEWYDHGFYNVRVGHEAILGLQKAFLHCNQPFKADIKSLYPTQDGVVMEQIWRGVCKNDIVRPDGTVVMKASGREFTSHVSFFLKVSPEGHITRIDEYDYRHWDEGKPEEEYTRVGQSLKSST